MVSMIVACSLNRVIGKSNDLPWKMATDLARFRELTSGKSVIMGRKTFDSIVARRGKPLPNRKNIIITRDKNLIIPGVEVATSPEEALKMAGPGEVFVIGGEKIFTEMLPVTDRIYLTRIQAQIDGDSFFPELVKDEWKETVTSSHSADELNEYDYDFVLLERTGA